MKLSYELEAKIVEGMRRTGMSRNDLVRRALSLYLNQDSEPYVQDLRENQ